MPCNTASTKDNEKSVHLPEFFKELLEGIPTNDAKTLWDWLDETPNAVDDMISVIVDSHYADRTSRPQKNEQRL